MANSKTLEILKEAILFEKRGKAFYQNAADNAKDDEVKHIFQIMADEEDDHVRFLSEQYKKFNTEGKFDAQNLPDNTMKIVADEIIDKHLTDKINAASFEASAISLAIDMENRAIAAYSERAENADDKEEKKFYEWLADWERSHHKLLYHIDQEIKDKIWHDNNFWPF
jgi:rubrerythrin